MEGPSSRFTHHYGIVRIYDDKKCWGILCDIMKVRDRNDGTARTVYGGDYFVHRSALRARVPEQCAEPRLHTGEYVEFLVDNTQPVDAQRLRRVYSVTGLFGGTLLCEHATVVFKSYTHLNRTLFPPTRMLRMNGNGNGNGMGVGGSGAGTAPPLGGGMPYDAVAGAPALPLSFPTPSSVAHESGLPNDNDDAFYPHATEPVATPSPVVEVTPIDPGEIVMQED